MRLQNCVLDVDKIITRPLVIERAESDWVRAHDEGLIPDALFRFYCIANYFSFRQAPLYLRDDRNILFTYLGSVTRGILDAMEEAHDLLGKIREYHERSYTPAKRQRGEEWDPKAHTKEIHSFKYLIMNLSGALDMFSEVVALFLTGEIEGLTVGRASFTTITRFVGNPLPARTGVVSPKRHYGEILYAGLRPLVISPNPEREWLDLFYLYRNKMAHLGNFMFRRMSFHDRDVNFYSFLPNQWPLIPEEEIQPGTTPPDANRRIREYCERCLVHQDVIEYSRLLVRRITDLLERGFNVLCGTYEAFRELPLNQDALDALGTASQSYAFLYFEEPS